MPDWTKAMKQSFEYYIVDPSTWRDIKPIENVKTCTITRDLNTDTLGSATIELDGLVGEALLRIYLITIQNGLRERHPLGTFLVQTPASKFDGKARSVSLDAYTPLLELKENPPPLGYSIFKDENIMSNAYMIMREHMRAPVVEVQCDKKLYSDFVANTDDTWLSFIKDLIANANYYLDLDENGRVLYHPKQNTAALQPVCTYDDGNSSILYPEVNLNHDIYGIPNVIEVVYSSGYDNYFVRVENNDPNSPVSTINRGREILSRITDPKLYGNPTKKQIQEYAEQTLKEASTVEYTASYIHGYRPTRLGDCVRLNYKKADLIDVKARVISQSIKCEPGCPVTEKAVYTAKLWR